MSKRVPTSVGLKPGRPDTAQVRLRFTADERAEIAEAVERAGDRNLTVWARRILLAEARKRR